MVSGFGLGGFATGFQAEQRTMDQQAYQQGLLGLEQKRLQQADQNRQRSEFMQLRADAVSHLDETVKQLKIAHPDWGPMQLANNPAIVSLKDMIGGFDKNLGLPNTIDSIVASLAERPSLAVTEGTLARAKEGPLKQQLTQSEIDRNKAIARSQPDLSNPDLDKDTQLGGQTDASGNPLPKSAGSKYISTPFTDRQKAIINQSGATPEQFDFDATMYAYGNTNVTQGYRSYRGVNPVTVMRSRAAQYWMDKGLSPQDANGVMVEFQAMKHGAQTAASIDARMTQALSKAENTAAILTEPGKNGKSLIDSVDRTQYKDLNDFLVNWRGRTGNQPEIRLAIALETLASNYGVSLGMGNSVLTDTQTARAQAMLQRGWATGQLGAAVDQIIQEMLREEAGTRQGMKRFIGGMQDTMEGGGAVTTNKKPDHVFNPDTGELE